MYSPMKKLALILFSIVLFVGFTISFAKELPKPNKVVVGYVNTKDFVEVLKNLRSQS